MPLTENNSPPGADTDKAKNTTRLRRENALLKASALQNAILTSANFSIIATDEKGVIQLFNVGAVRMLGYTASEVVDQISLSDLHDPQEEIAHAQSLSLELETPIAPGFEALAFKASRGIEDVYELTFIRKDGSRFLAMLSITALRDEDGKIIGYLLIGTDITQRKEVEAELRKNEWRLRYATESARLTYIEADLAGGGARTPANFATVMGYPPPSGQEADISVGSRLLIEHAVPEDRLRVAAALQEFLLGTPTGQVEYRVLGDDQIERWIETRWSVEFARDGKPLKSFATNLDITERKHAELKIRENEERYRTLFNSMDEGYCIIEMIFDEHHNPVDWLFLEVNPAFEKHTGLQGATGKRMLELVPDQAAFNIDIYASVALTGEPVRFQSESKALGRWFDIYAFRIGEPQSRKVAVIFNNINERKQFELNLKEAIAVADKANSAKTDFISSMSHELRTPLNAILGFAQLLESGSPPPAPSQKQRIDQILKGGWYLLDLINEILDLALIESGKMPMSQEPVSLIEVMLECQVMIEPQAQKRGIGLTISRLEVPGFVNADRTRLKQVLINLLSNAIKYNKPGGTVTVEYTQRMPDLIRVSVRDTGAGLSAEQLAQLFQPFNRLGMENSAEEGTGIGLMMTKRLVELMGGVIGADSVPGIGSVFWIELNLAAAPQSVAEDAGAVTRMPSRVPDGAPLSTLLYVEDNPANLELVEQIIARRSDLRLLSTTDGNLGIELTRTHLPQVILMDVNLPGINGIEVMNILRADPSTAYIPIIALSANALPRDIENGLKAGFFSYLTKPIKVTQFMDALDVALDYSNVTSSRTIRKKQTC